jgi:hypothetical protein
MRMPMNGGASAQAETQKNAGGQVKGKYKPFFLTMKSTKSAFITCQRSRTGARKKKRRPPAALDGLRTSP